MRQKRMSASEPPGPEALVEEFPITPEEAVAIAEAMGPIQNITGSAGSMGKTLNRAPGVGPKFAGAVLQNISAQVNLASTSFETLARAMQFYIESQSGAAGDLFPPPEVVAAQAEEDIDPLVKLLVPGDQDAAP